jgi:hypothetical protein
MSDEGVRASLVVEPQGESGVCDSPGKQRRGESRNDVKTFSQKKIPLPKITTQSPRETVSLPRDESPSRSINVVVAPCESQKCLQGSDICQS